MVISCRILKVNVSEQKGASKQIAVLDISQYLFSLLFPSAKCCFYSTGVMNSGAEIKGEIQVFSHAACHSFSCHNAACHNLQEL